MIKRRCCTLFLLFLCGPVLACDCQSTPYRLEEADHVLIAHVTSIQLGGSDAPAGVGEQEVWGTLRRVETIRGEPPDELILRWQPFHCTGWSVPAIEEVFILPLDRGQNEVLMSGCPAALRVASRWEGLDGPAVTFLDHLSNFKRVSEKRFAELVSKYEWGVFPPPPPPPKPKH
jgi:hypothetical protein